MELQMNFCSRPSRAEAIFVFFPCCEIVTWQFRNGPVPGRGSLKIKKPGTAGLFG
jgi:hypothetical protein